jgi:hypothetical protein
MLDYSIPVKHRVTSGDIQFHYMSFDSVSDYNGFVDQEINRLSIQNKEVWDDTMTSTISKIQRNSEWYGSPSPKQISDLEEHKNFLGMHLIKKVQPKIKAHLEKYMRYLDSVIMPKPKLAYNNKGLGIFSFDRAAMGLHRAPKINLSTPIDKTLTQLNIELGRDNLQTSMKDVYAYFQNKNTSSPSLRLYIMAGANALVKGDDLLYVGLACAELIEFMELRNVGVEVNVLLGSYDKGNVCMSVIRVKRFQDRLDKNQLLLMSSDPRYFRYRGFKGIIATYNRLGFVVPEGLGSMKESMGKDFVGTLGKKAFVFEQSYSLENAAKEVTKIIQDYNQNLKNGKKGN